MRPNPVPTAAGSAGISRASVLASLAVAVVLAALGIGLALHFSQPTTVTAQAEGGSADADGPDAAARVDDPIDALRQRARAALAAERLVEPPGDNAIELQLAILERDPDDPFARAALTELFPFALLATEQRLAAGDLAASERLVALLRRADPEAPALPRLDDALSGLRARLAASAAASASPSPATMDAGMPDAGTAAAGTADAGGTQATRPQPAVASRDAMPQGGAAPGAARDGATPAPVDPATSAGADAAGAAVAGESVATDAVVPPSAPPQASAGSAPQAAAAPPPAAVEASGPPPVLERVQPRYPAQAMRRRVEGRVELAFIVAADGSVEAVRVVSAEPGNVFEREAIAAMRGWRFAPIGRASEGRQTFEFRLDARD